MVGVTCSNIELKDAGWNTFLRNNECNLLKYNSNYRRFESSSRYQSGQFYGVVRFFVCRNEWSGKRRAICSSSRYHKISKAMKENKDTACEPCEQNFERNINRLVKEGKAPTPKARQQKEHEVKSAFAETEKERK